MEKVVRKIQELVDEHEGELIVTKIEENYPPEAQLVRTTVSFSIRSNSGK